MSKIRILHTADLHMDSPFESLSEGKAAIRRAELRALPKKIAALAIKEKVDVVLLSGDLLDGESVYRETADELAQYLRKIPAPVFIAPGNHDYYSSSSAYARMDLSNNIYLFQNNEVEHYDFPEKGFRVYGAAFTGKDAPALLNGFHAERTSGMLSLMCIHGETDAPKSLYNPITTEEIAESGLDYLALGHIHKASGLQRAGNTRYAQPGCPEGRGFDEQGRKTVNLVEYENGTWSLRSVRIASRLYEQIAVDVTDTDPLFAIQMALPDDTVRDIYRIILKGETDAPVNLKNLTEQLSEYFFEVQLRDETRLKEDIWARAGSDTLRGLFLSKMKTRYDAAPEEEKNRIEQAVRWGVAALDNREEVVRHENQ